MGRVLTLGAVLVAAGLAGGWWYVGVRADVPPEPTTAVVGRGDLERNVTALGKLEPLQHVDVGTQVSGQLERIHVAPGDVVRAGDLLAEIDPTVYRARVEADRANLQGLEAQLAERRAQLRLAEQQHRRQLDLIAADATSQELVESAAAELEIARARIAGIEAEIAKARSTLAADEASLRHAEIRAPMAGTVMSLSARQGQTLNANQQAPVVLQIADLETMTVRAQVSEADIGKLRVGMEAYFTTLGDPERRWTGRLRQILPTPEVVNDVVLYNALFDVGNADRRLMPQMTAQVFFVLDRAEDALLVPLAALGPPDAAGRRTVRVRSGGAVEERAVTIGLADRVSAEVVSGLAPGDEVVVGMGGEPEGRPEATG